MKGIIATPVIWAILSVGLSLLSVFAGLSDIQTLSVPGSWTRDFLILVSISSLASLAVILRRRRPVRYLFLAIRVITIILVSVPFEGLQPVEFYLLTAVIIDISFALPFAPAVAATIFVILAGLGIQAGFSAYYFRVETPSRIDLAAFGVWGVAAGTLCLFINRLREAYRLRVAESEHRGKVIEELIGANRDYLEYASSVEAESADKERKRIITELHDIVGQSFTNILALTDMAGKHPPRPDEWDDLFGAVKSQAHSGLDETRAILYKLHTFKSAAPTGLREFHRLVSVFTNSTRIAVDVNWVNLPWDLGAELNDTVYKVIRESLINSFRHGNAKRVTIHFRVSHNILYMDIVDDGRGSDSIEKGIGLSSMEERVHRAKGRASFTSSGPEFTVHIELPVGEKNTKST